MSAEVRKNVAFALFALDPQGLDSRISPAILRLLNDEDKEVIRECLINPFKH